MASFSVRSFVPSHSWSCSGLNVNRTLPPCLFSIPLKGTGGSGSYNHNYTVIFKLICATVQHEEICHILLTNAYFRYLYKTLMHALCQILVLVIVGTE